MSGPTAWREAILSHRKNRISRMRGILVDPEDIHANDVLISLGHYEVSASNQPPYNKLNIFGVSIDTGVRVNSRVLSEQVFGMCWCQVYPFTWVVCEREHKDDPRDWNRPSHLVFSERCAHHSLHIPNTLPTHSGLFCALSGEIWEEAYLQNGCAHNLG